MKVILHMTLYMGNYNVLIDIIDAEKYKLCNNILLL